MITPRLVGVHSNLALFEARGRSVVVNTKTLTASAADEGSALLDRAWRKHRSAADPVWAEIAAAAIKREITPADITLATSSKRTYTVPKRVLEAASNSNRMLSFNERSAVSAHVANLLASGAQVTVQDVLWVSRFFENHEESSTDRATWMAWGGDAGKNWSQGLASRLDYDAVVADAGDYATPGVQSFVDSEELGRSFYCQMDSERGQHALSLFMLDEFGVWNAWGNGDWFACETPAAQASPLIELDEEAALYVAGALFDAPDTAIDLRTPNPEAWDLAVAAYDDIDWTLADRAMFADAPPAENPVTAEDGGYTPEERSQNAEGQVRDANGRFAQVGDTGAIKSTGIAGKITAADPANGTLAVAGDDGQSYNIPASDFEVGAAAHPKADPSAAKDAIDFDGILAPTKESAPARAQLPSAQPLLSPVEINDALDMYAQYIHAKRQINAKNFHKLLVKDGKKPEDESPEEDATENGEEPVTAAGAPGAPANQADDVPPPSANPTPDESDVTPVYLAIVDPDDHQAVMDLVALVPATATSSDPKTFRRSGGKWVEDNKILTDLRSPTPPSVVTLDADQFADVLAQVDAANDQAPAESGDDTQSVTAPGAPAAGTEPTETPAQATPLTAAGGLDQNRGNAETLRHYWTVGPGGLKIRWGTGGDWTRCVRLLSKHLGNRAKGYCALRHHEMTGMWPGDARNRDAIAASAYEQYPIRTRLSVIRASAAEAEARTAMMRVFGGDDIAPIPASADDIIGPRQGKRFRIPIVIPENLNTGDGRIFAKGAVGLRTLPLPLLWQIKTGEGHNGAVLVGSIQSVQRTEWGLGEAIGVFDVGPYGQEAQRLCEAGMLRWISVDLDKFEIDETRSDQDKRILFVKKARLMGATMVAKPAFQECTIEIYPEEEIVIMDVVPSTIAASASIANAIPVEPPSVWFERPLLNGPTPIQVTNEGQIFGHIATFRQDHLNGISPRAPRSHSGYAYFHTGVLRTAEGQDVKVGQLTLAGGHASVYVDAAAAAKHYDDTGSAVADIHVGEDKFGIWCAGALRPGTTPEQIRTLRASAPSGDWRVINHRHELVAICQVNVPGYPVPRALVASANGEELAIVAAGTAELIELRQAEFSPEAVALAARERMNKALGVENYMTEKRKKKGKENCSLADGSFPIENVVDLRRAISALELLDRAQQSKVRRHIVFNARELGKEEMVPSSWKELKVSNAGLRHRDNYEAQLALAEDKRLTELRSRVYMPSVDELEIQALALRDRISNR